jgi:hypothetical protein
VELPAAETLEATLCKSTAACEAGEAAE